jgi:hypothetical protein
MAIDVHTGLGPRGFDSLLPEAEGNDATMRVAFDANHLVRGEGEVYTIQVQYSTVQYSFLAAWAFVSK